MRQLSGTPTQGLLEPHGAQLIVASQPADVTEPSEVKTKVRQPVVETTVPGEPVPLNTPIIGEAAVAPL